MTPEATSGASSTATVETLTVEVRFLRGELPVPLKALERVLLGYFMSLPEGWRLDRGQLDRSVVEGRDAVSNALKGLEGKGYLRRTKKRDELGAWSWSWQVTLDPINQPFPEPHP